MRIEFCGSRQHAEAMKTKIMFSALLLLSTLMFLAPPTAPAVEPAATTAPVYIIPIHGQIEGALLYVIRRGIAEAERQNAAAIILPMDTPGGTLNAASDIVRAIQASKLPVYTFVEKDAFSAGAIIALATRGIYMAPGSVIGDALPIMMTPFGGVQEMPEAMEEKAVSAVSALVRSAAQEAGHNPELAESMVRRETEFKVGDDVICPAGRLLTLTAEEASRPGPDEKPLLAAGTPKTLDDLLELLDLKARWSKLTSVACIESTREIAGRVETEKRYVISSLPADSHRILHAVRTHWGIENGLHWCLDVTFGEDASLIRLRNAAQNFSFLRRLALNLFRADKSRSISLPRKLKTAAYNPAYLATALQLREI